MKQNQIQPQRGFVVSSIWSFTIILGCPWHSNKSKSWQKQNSIKNNKLIYCRSILLNESSFCARVQYFTSQRRFSIRGISRVTRGYFLTLFAFYSLVSSVTYLQILTTNLFCGKFHKFQFLKKSLVWKFRNKIFSFKKITHYRIFLNFHHKCSASFPIDIWNKKDRSPTLFLR
jgi:hypothetical protein